MRSKPYGLRSYSSGRRGGSGDDIRDGLELETNVVVGVGIVVVDGSASAMDGEAWASVWPNIERSADNVDFWVDMTCTV